MKENGKANARNSQTTKRLRDSAAQSAPVRPGSAANPKGEQEVELAVYRQALERARSDMQAFAYSVSHDLRAPLRAIQGFSKILLEDFSAQLDAEAQQFLKHIIQNTQTLANQMDDLLRFSRAGKNTPSKIPIKTSDFVSALVEELRPEVPSNFKIAIGPLPRIEGDPVLLRQALSELIRNAAKFTAGVLEPRAEISGEEDRHSVVLCIRDNGVGFNPEQAGKLFQVFQKLHSSADFPGNGIGLAIVKRIIEAHGGCVEAEGSDGGGAAFFLALPHGDAKAPLECLRWTRTNPVLTPV